MPEIVRRKTVTVKVGRVRVGSEVAVVVRRQDKLLLVQRPDAGRWAKMWEFPHHEIAGTETHSDAAQRLLRGLGLHAQVADEIATINSNKSSCR